MKKAYSAYFLVALALAALLIPASSWAAESGSQFLQAGLTDTECRDPFLVFRELTNPDRTITAVTEALGYAQCLAFSIIRLLFSVGVVAAAILVAINGVRYQLARGNPKLVEAAVKNIQSALIGLALLFLIGTAINLVLTFVEYDYLANPDTNINVRSIESGGQGIGESANENGS